MGLIYDDPQLAALTLTRIAAEESEGLSGRASEEDPANLTDRTRREEFRPGNGRQDR